ncbi:glycosyltransferase [Candidatus Berkelbacteria bacterium]|nr:glycosyltransferase [Candidatus Berkelbacteria bacterium]
MKIIIGSVSFYPNISGVAIAAQLLARSLASRGHEVRVIAPAQTRKNYVERANAAGITVHRLAAIPNPLRRGFFIPYLPKRHVARIVHEFKPDIVHLQDPTNLAMVLMAQAQKNTIPVIITHHFTFEFVLSYLPPAFRRLTKQALQKQLVHLYNRADALIAPTQTIRATLAEIGVTAPIHVISNGVDISRFQGASKKSGKNIVLYLGRIDQDKSLDVLIEAFGNIRTQLDAQLIVAGTGDYYQTLRQLVIKKNLSKSVSFTGAIDHEDPLLVDIMRSADVFAIPSTIESQSIATMEAMAAGKPIVAARAGALPEMVKHGANGYLFEPGDSAKLANYVTKILRNKTLAKKMGRKSRTRIASHNLTKSHRLVEQLYMACITKRIRGRRILGAAW